MSIASLGKRVLFEAARFSGVNWLLRKRSKGRLLVLCYHAVIPEGVTDDRYRTRNAVSTRDFESQLLALCRVFQPISATDLLESFGGKSLPTFPVLVTFDDGFQNNLTWAAPILEKLGVPALIHVTTGHIGRDELLWPQELDERVLAWTHKTIPTPGGGRDRPMPAEHSKRIALADQIRSECKQLPNQEKNTYLDRLRDGPLPLEAWHRELYKFLNWDEVRKLSQKGFAIGSHTVTHPILTKCSQSELKWELSSSKARIEQELGFECPWIAYPNGGPGDFSSEVASVTEECGYRVAFVLTEKPNPVSPAKLQIDRVCISNHLSSAGFHARISGLC